MSGQTQHCKRGPKGIRLCLSLMIGACLLLEAALVSPLSAAPLLRHEAPAVAVDDGRYDVALGFFERLFKRRSRKKEEEKTKRTKKPVRRAGPVKPVISTVSKDPDAAVIAVFGDEFGQDIAWGLKDAFSQVPDVKVEIHAKPSSGILYNSSRNVLKDPEALFDSKPFSFAVVMVGLNDRIKMPAKKDEEGAQIYPAYDFKTDGWVRSYGREIDRLRLAFALQDRPVFWVGLPPVGSKKLSTDLRYLNDLVASRLTERGERFIDVWDAFADEEGNFSYRGPDLTGQDRRLRQGNAIRFNKAGRRKLAFFVEKLVVRALSQSVAEDVLPDNLASADEAALREGRGASRDIFVLRKPPLDSDKLVKPVSLAQPSDAANKGAPVTPSSLSVPQMRVDNFSWSDSR
ncbi:SGNH/GDSL hydrolase family protein [Cohaesibacter intestini]|uniref:SGNH/GDSL hydrolase family protein n=1 Tax=Cohaesibacter intestini TaxID=2211145 RepID=UPI000DEAA4AE|nr:DUF459 domain-containing protein [Cohaesibacter intestini]